MPSPLGLTVKTDIYNMEIGDCIIANFPNPTTWNITDIGKSTANEIPFPLAPNTFGSFYFIKADKNLYISDRLLSLGPSWLVTEIDGWIFGKYITRELVMGKDIETVSLQDPSNYLDGYDLYKAFDGDSSTWHQSKTFPTTINIVLDKAYSLQSIISKGYETNYNPRTVSIMATNDPSIGYTTLVNNYILSNNASRQSIPIPTPKKYKYFKIIYSDGNGWGQLCLRSISLIANYMKIRSLSGGIGYIDDNGLLSTNYNSKNLAFPKDNEYDSYIIQSSLNGKITPGDDNVWHWKGPGTLCQDTIIQTTQCTLGNAPANAKTIRGGNPAVAPNVSGRPHTIGSIDYVITNSAGSNYFGYRPVLELV